MNCCTTTPIIDARDTLRSALRQLEAVQSLQRPWALAEAHRAVAGAYRELGALSSALAMLETAQRWAHALGCADQQVDLLCETIEVLARQSEAQERVARGGGRAARERARDLVFDTRQRLARVADPQWEITVLLRLSDVLDRFGDHDDATQLQLRALRLTVDAAACGSSGPAADPRPGLRH